MQVNLECNFFIETVVLEASQICMIVGYGFFLDLSNTDRSKSLTIKSSLHTENSNSLTEESMNINALIQHVC